MVAIVGLIGIFMWVSSALYGISSGSTRVWWVWTGSVGLFVAFAAHLYLHIYMGL